MRSAGAVVSRTTGPTVSTSGCGTGVCSSAGDSVWRGVRGGVSKDAGGRVSCVDGCGVWSSMGAVVCSRVMAEGVGMGAGGRDVSAVGWIVSPGIGVGGSVSWREGDGVRSSVGSTV